MKRKIVKIDEEKCNGCGLCISACHEGALQLVDGKARLISDSYCDGLGDCLPECPTGAITLEVREADAFVDPAPVTTAPAENAAANVSQLRQWPCQIKLVPVNAPYFDGAHLLIAADCTAFAYANIHSDFMRNKITLIGCPKLDSVNYAEKLAEILRRNNIKSITVLKMEVPCCSGLALAVKNALIASGKMIPWSIVTISTEGSVIEE